MAISPVSSNIVAPGSFEVPTVSKPKKPQLAATDTVKISTAARVLQKKTAAPAQTVEAAATGDLQAKAQLAKPATVPTVRK